MSQCLLQVSTYVTYAMIINYNSLPNWTCFKSVCTNFANTLLGSASDCRSDTWCIICRLYYSNVSHSLKNFLLIFLYRKNPLKHEHAHEENDSTAIPRRKPSHAFITITNPKKLRNIHQKKVCRQTLIIRAYVSLFKTLFKGRP